MTAQQMLTEPVEFDDRFAAVYGELRRLARKHFRGERPGHTLAATALVHEVYLRLMGAQGEPPKMDAGGPAQDRALFFATVARAMRQTLIDHARRRNAGKRGGQHQKLTLDERHAITDLNLEELLTLENALARLARLSSRMAAVVEYRFFCGMQGAEIAELLGVTERTVEREWRNAKAWLHSELYSPV